MHTVLWRTDQKNERRCRRAAAAQGRGSGSGRLRSVSDETFDVADEPGARPPRGRHAAASDERFCHTVTVKDFDTARPQAAAAGRPQVRSERRMVLYTAKLLNTALLLAGGEW